MLSGYDLYQSEEFEREMGKLRISRLKYPRGGHYNDGYELLATLKCGSIKELLSLLDRLGIIYSMHSEKPPFWCPPPVMIDGNEQWIEYKNQFEYFGFNTYITVGTTEFYIEFNLNTGSWYDVTMDDVKNAINFEKILIDKNIIKA